MVVSSWVRARSTNHSLGRCLRDYRDTRPVILSPLRGLKTPNPSPASRECGSLPTTDSAAWSRGELPLILKSAHPLSLRSLPSCNMVATTFEYREERPKFANSACQSRSRHATFIWLA